jgi:hypothetical protein
MPSVCRGQEGEPQQRHGEGGEATADAVGRLHHGARLRANRLGSLASVGYACPEMKLLLFFLVALVLVGGAIKLAGQQIPILEYPLGGPMAQPKIEIVQPHLNMP